jgi:flagellar protein FlaF
VGFGVSGSTAIIFLGLLVATGTLYTAASTTAERLDEAHDDDQERLLDRKNTDVEIASASNVSTNLEVKVTNTGSTTLSVEGTTLLVDNSYVSPDTTKVEGDQATDVWAPGETLTFEVVDEGDAARIKVVTENGVAATAVVS